MDQSTPHTFSCMMPREVSQQLTFQTVGMSQTHLLIATSTDNSRPRRMTQHVLMPQTNCKPFWLQNCTNLQVWQHICKKINQAKQSHPPQFIKLWHLLPARAHFLHLFKMPSQQVPISQLGGLQHDLFGVLEPQCL